MTKNNKKFLLFLIPFCGLTYFIWAIITPFNGAPDEFHRFDIVSFIHQFKDLPTIGDSRLNYSVYGRTYASGPILPYILSSFLLILFDKLIDPTQLYFVARMISVISGILAVYYVYKICDKLVNNNLKYFIPVLFAMMPQYAFLCGYVNAESFMIFAIVFVFHTLLEGYEKHWPYQYIFRLALGISFILLSYLNGYVVIPAAFLFLFITLYQIKKTNWELFRKLTLFCLIVFIFSSWWFIRNYIIYDGDIMAFKAGTAYAEEIAKGIYKPSIYPSPYVKGMSVFEMLFQEGWIRLSYRSFWGIFGYMSIYLNNSVYNSIFVVHLLSIIGVIVYAYRKLNIPINQTQKIINLLKDNLFHIILIFIILMSVSLSIYFSYYSDFQPQGRYLFPALFPIILYFGIGLDKLMDFTKLHKYKSKVFKLLMFLVVLLNVYSLYICLKIYYFSPPLLEFIEKASK